MQGGPPNNNRTHEGQTTTISGQRRRHEHGLRRGLLPQIHTPSAPKTQDWSEYGEPSNKPAFNPESVTTAIGTPSDVYRLQPETAKNSNRLISGPHDDGKTIQITTNGDEVKVFSDAQRIAGAMKSVYGRERTTLENHAYSRP